MSILSFARAAGLALVLCACAQPETTTQQAAEAPMPSAPSQFEQLVVETAGGPVTFEVEIADNDEERARGLMFRQTLPGYRGMLFDMDPPEMASFWMRNTILSLDIIFIGVDGRIINIADHTTPQSDAPIPAAGLTRGVLEIGAGRAQALGIQPGDRVRHRIFPAG